MTYRYLLFYKPYDVLSQFTDGEGRKTLKDFVDVPGVYAVGRLDRDSEGLLLLTDDGPMQHRLSHPKFGHGRQYWVQVEVSAIAPPLEESLAKLRSGVTIRGYQTRPAQAQAIAAPDIPPRNPPIRYRKQVPTAWLELILSEGKNRQVRRMTAAVGFPTLRLVRSAILLPRKKPTGNPTRKPEGNRTDQTALNAEKTLSLSGLQPGQWRDLTKAEVRSLPRLNARYQA